MERELERAQELARIAGREVLRMQRGELKVEMKPGDEPVSVADRRASEIIVAGLVESFPGDKIISEELPPGPGTIDAPRKWLVDPIDGTKAFVRRYPMFSTQIALIHRGELVLGVSSAPEYGEIAWARRGGGAFIDGAPLRVASTSEFGPGSAISIGNVKTLTRDARWDVLGELIRRSGRIRGYGDFLHYHLLARGALDLVIESDVNILDIAALAVIVREAGGVFTTLEGAELSLDTTSVLAGTPALHAQALALFGAARRV